MLGDPKEKQLDDRHFGEKKLFDVICGQFRVKNDTNP